MVSMQVVNLIDRICPILVTVNQNVLSYGCTSDCFRVDRETGGFIPRRNSRKSWLATSVRMCTPTPPLSSVDTPTVENAWQTLLRPDQMQSETRSYPAPYDVKEQRFRSLLNPWKNGLNKLSHNSWLMCWWKSSIPRQVCLIRVFVNVPYE